MTLTWLSAFIIYSPHIFIPAGTISGEEMPIIARTNIKEHRDSFSCEKFNFRLHHNITFYVYVTNFSWPIKIQVGSLGEGGTTSINIYVDIDLSISICSQCWMSGLNHTIWSSSLPISRRSPCVKRIALTAGWAETILLGKTATRFNDLWVFLPLSITYALPDQISRQQPLNANHPHSHLIIH